ncbi:gliding motility-associated C-terminal domain-containing protein [Pedobacter sp. SYP-B3415]|uniref:T9SS type B sorting domain-containing protein n=1 Tax=Pedobacter sp. SYP-B3415 TaxID=2496641 RepID=UPI00101BEEF2|nr:gliding motility-associated C-terminal domain-containing protein [Pedobacter sp. SYP-B3415]
MKLYIKLLLCLILPAIAWQASAQDIISRGGTLTVSADNSNAGENSSKFVDNNVNSKFLLFNFASGTWMQWQCRVAAVCGQYTLTSGDDAPERDPKSWTLSGSNDGTTWTLLDTRTNETFQSRKQTRYFKIANTTPYLYYRLTISAINGATLFQASEWRLLEGAIPLAPEPSGSALSQTEIKIDWKAVEDATGFELERSIAGAAFTRIATLGSNVTTYTDKNLNARVKYTYRMRSLGAVANSPYTANFTVTTKSDVEGTPTVIPNNVLSPNGDGINDTWTIKYLDYYEKNEVLIYDKTGRMVFRQANYKNDWNATFEGRPLPEGTYYYVIRFWPGIPDAKGALFLVRDR